MDRKDDDKIRLSQFCSQSKKWLNIKIKAAKIFTFFQTEFVLSQNTGTRGQQSDKFS
jgi:hypothetical protein